MVLGSCEVRSASSLCPKPHPLVQERAQDFLGGLAVKDSALSLLWLGLDPWPRELLHAMGSAKTKETKKERAQMNRQKSHKNKENIQELLVLSPQKAYHLRVPVVAHQ